MGRSINPFTPQLFLLVLCVLYGPWASKADAQELWPELSSPASAIGGGENDAAVVVHMSTIASFDPGRIEAGGALLPDGRAQEELERALFGSMEAFIREYPDHWWAYEDIWDLRRMDNRNREMFSRVSKLRLGARG